MDLAKWRDAYREGRANPYAAEVVFCRWTDPIVQPVADKVNAKKAAAKEQLIKKVYTWLMKDVPSYDDLPED